MMAKRSTYSKALLANQAPGAPGRRRGIPAGTPWQALAIRAAARIKAIQSPGTIQKEEDANTNLPNATPKVATPGTGPVETQATPGVAGTSLPGPGTLARHAGTMPPRDLDVLLHLPGVTALEFGEEGVVQAWVSDARFVAGLPREADGYRVRAGVRPPLGHD
jgi:hypothetical protein